MNMRKAGAVRPSRYVNSKAFRAGYEDYRTGKRPRFTQWGQWGVAYEEGRLTAAMLIGRGEALRPIPTEAKVDTQDLRWLLMARYTLPQKARAAA
jgi:hypothetical protein